MIRRPLLAAAAIVLCCPTAYAQTHGGVITPPSTKPDGSVLTPPVPHVDPGIEKSPDKGVDQSQLPQGPRPDSPKKPGDTGTEGGTLGMPRR